MLATASSPFLLEVVGHLFVAIVCGGLIGFERQLRGKSVGIRPCVIVVLTTSFLTDLGTTVTAATGDPSRLIAAIVTGVGFLGGGVILAQGLRIRGITTASLIWALASIGIAIGLGYAYAALALTLTIMAVMAVTELLERKFPTIQKNSPMRKDD